MKSKHEAKRFSLRAVLAVAGRILVSSERTHESRLELVGEAIDLTEWMTEERPAPIQFNRFCDECGEKLREIFPEIIPAIHTLRSMFEIYVRIENPSEDKAIECYREIKACFDRIAKEELKPFYEVPRLEAERHAKLEPYSEAVAILIESVINCQCENCVMERDKEKGQEIEFKID